MADSISAVICAHTFDRWELLLSAIESVQAQTLPAHELIVVIDHNPELRAAVAEAVSGVRLIENDQTPGLSGARNSGVAAASGEIVAFLDDDAEADSRWLEQLAAAYADDRVLGAGGSIEAAWPEGRPGWFPAEFDWVVGCTYRGIAETRHEVRNLIGCNMSFRRQVLEGVGGFRNGFGTAGSAMKGACRCEETELCIRAGQLWPDGRFMYEPQARVRHHVAPGRTAWSYFRARCYSEGLSKAEVAKLAGAGQGLSAERSYTLRALPNGVVQGLRDALAGDWAGLSRAWAILSGLTITTAGYVVGRAQAT